MAPQAKQLSQGQQYKLKRAKELEPLVNCARPKHGDVSLYFMYMKQLNDAGIGWDVSLHPLNPFKENKTSLTLDEKEKKAHTDIMLEQEIIDFLIAETENLRHEVLDGGPEPSMEKRMTFFAYQNLLRVKYNIGSDLSLHYRNPWVGKSIPESFAEFSGIKSLPEKFNSVIKPTCAPQNEKTAVFMYRVFDAEHKKNTIQEGTKEACEQFAEDLNTATGYIKFSVENTGTYFFPSEKGVSVAPSCCGAAPKQIGFNNNYYSPKPPVKNRVQDYLTKFKK